MNNAIQIYLELDALKKCLLVYKIVASVYKIFLFFARSFQNKLKAFKSWL